MVLKSVEGSCETETMLALNEGEQKSMTITRANTNIEGIQKCVQNDRTGLTGTRRVFNLE